MLTFCSTNMYNAVSSQVLYLLKLSNMEEAKIFGAKLRELRLRASLTLRELAARVNVDFTYLSKIESEVKPPPSEKVILKLAAALNSDKDELMVLSGRVPSDLIHLLKNKDTLQFLRKTCTKKMLKSFGNREEVNIIKYLVI